MRLCELLAAEISARCAEPIEGVRLSPFPLEANELEDLEAALRSALGDGLHLAICSPGAERRESARLHVCEDESAAQVATLWRNTIDSSSGDRLVYISHRKWGKAGGLDETLTPMSGADLQNALSRRAKAGEFGEVVRALEEANVVSEVPARVMCEFISLVAESADPEAAAGANLPMLGLFADSALEVADLVARLKANKALKHQIETGERKKRSAVIEDIQYTIRDRGAEAVDVGGLVTEELQLSSGAGPRKKKSAKKQTKKRAARRTQKRKKKPAGEATPCVDPMEDLARAVVGTAEEREHALSGLTASEAEAGAKEDVDNSAEMAAHARAFSGEVDGIPRGIGQLVEAIAAGDGRRVVLNLSDDADLRSTLAGALPMERLIAADDVELTCVSDLVAGWRKARRAVADRLASASARERVSLAGLVRAPLIALADEELGQLVEDLLAASKALYRAAVERGDPDFAVGVSTLDTATLQAGERTLTVVGPLHPLWLGQAVTRLAQVREEEEVVTPAAGRLIARALSRAPSAPQTMRLPGGLEARLAPSVGGLICFETRPALAGDSALADLGADLVSAYLDVHPYASLGLRVRLRGGAPGALLDGMARALGEPRGLARLEICADAQPGPLRAAASRVAVEEGRLTFQPAEGAAAAAHIEVVLRTDAGDDSAEVPGAVATAPSFAAGPLATQFAEFMGGLRAVTSVVGVPGVAEFEELHAATGGYAPRGRFMVEPRGVSLAGALAESPTVPAAWRCVIAPGVASDPAPGDFVLALEQRGEGLGVGVVCDTIAPASRVIDRPLKQMGVRAPSPRSRVYLADQLAARGRGLLALGGGQAGRFAGLVLEARLRAELQERGAEPATIAELRGRLLASLTPGGLGGGAVCLGVGLEGDALRFVVGYAAVEDPLELEIARGHLQGDLAETLGAVLEAIRIAAEKEGVRSAGVQQVCAREALAWALCPAAAEEGAPESARLLTALHQLGHARDVSVDVEVLLAPSHKYAHWDRPVRLKDCDVQFTALSTDLLDELVRGVAG